MESRRWVKPFMGTGHRDRAIVSSVTATVYLSGQDGRWQQLGITCSLISVPQWHHMDCHEFTGSEKCCLCKQTWLSLALSLVCLDSARVWLSCQAIKWIAVLAGLCRVLANPVTYINIDLNVYICVCMCSLLMSHCLCYFFMTF